MTFSIAARSADGAQLGVAVASKFLAVGNAVPAAEVGAGAVATQAMANLRYRGDGLAMLRDGRTPEDVIRSLTQADEQRAHRQVGVIGTVGPGASFTGEECIPWAGGTTGPGYAVQGNCLAGPDVVAAIARTWLSAEGPFPRQLLAALLAGDRAGGDKRGRQSAALYVVEHNAGYGGGSDVVVDLRVDDHPDPVPELERLLDLHDVYFGKPDPATLVPLAGEIAAEVAERLAALGFDDLMTWMGNENYEERWVVGHIDPVVLGKLREASA